MIPEEFIKYNQRGLIPGPNETEEQFLKRVHYCLNLQNTLSEQMGVAPPSIEGQKYLKGTSTMHLFGFHADWVPVIFSNHRLFPWHGGCAWIFQLSPEDSLGAFLQLRTAFAKSAYLGYCREEILSHECAHIGRMAFNEPKFEEFFAYKTAKTAFRRYLGPIISKSWEVVLFFISLLLSLFILEALFLPLLLLLLAFIRLTIRHQQLQRAKDNLQSLFEHPEWVLYRLTDAEIVLFSKSSPQQIQNYISNQHSLRWQFINDGRMRGPKYDLDEMLNDVRPENKHHQILEDRQKGNENW